MSRVRIGFIGAGGIAQAHLPTLRARGDAVELVGVADVNPAAAEATAKKFQITRFVTDYHELFPHCDAVVVCVPTHLHWRIACDALHAGKHVFCEKPMARTLEQAQAMYDAHANSGKQL